MVARGLFRCKDRSEPRSSMGVLLAEGMGIKNFDCSFPYGNRSIAAATQLEGRNG